MTDALQLALSDFYKAHVYRGMPVSTAVNPVRDALADPAIKVKAIQRLGELNDLNAKCAGQLGLRCFVSSVEKTALEEALRD